MNSKMVLGQYFNSNSWIHRLDPRTKILTVIVFMVLVFLLNNLLSVVCMLALIIILILTSKIPFMKFLKSLQMLTFIIFFAFICQVLFRKTGELLVDFSFTLTVFNLIIGVLLLTLYFLSKKVIKKGRFLLFLIVIIGAFALQVIFIKGYVITNYHIKIYEDSLTTSLFLILRIICLLFMSSLLTLTTKPTELNIGLESLLKPLRIFKINVSILSMMISIALRYIPTLINEANKILKAQASRGVDFKESKLKEKITQIVSLIVPMFIIAYQRALDLSDAMEARGYDPDKKRTSINVLKMRLMDGICLGLTLSSIIVVIVLKIIINI